jgi:hypothetical protein
MRLVRVAVFSLLARGPQQVGDGPAAGGQHGGTHQDQ